MWCSTWSGWGAAMAEKRPYGISLYVLNSTRVRFHRLENPSAFNYEEHVWGWWAAVKFPYTVWFLYAIPWTCGRPQWDKRHPVNMSCRIRLCNHLNNLWIIKSTATKSLCFFRRRQSTWHSPAPRRAVRCHPGHLALQVGRSARRTLLLKFLNTATQELKIVTVISQRVKQTILKYHLLSHLKAVGYVFSSILYIQSSDLEKTNTINHFTFKNRQSLVTQRQRFSLLPSAYFTLSHEVNIIGTVRKFEILLHR